MYRQYMHGSFSPIAQNSNPSGGSCIPEEHKSSHAKPKDPLIGLKDGLSGLLSGLGKHGLFSNFDTGDILLILIILFLFLEGDNLELVITLGLMLLFGLDDTHSAS